MTRTLAAIAAAVAAVATASFAAVKPANDVGVKMKVKDATTAGPLAEITLKNQGTVDQNGVTVTVYAENENGGLVLWTGAVDLPAKKSTKVAQRIWLDQDTTVLVARAELAATPDEHPVDDAARGALGLKGKPALALVGRSIHLAACASCHGQDAGGGAAPAIVGATSKAVLGKVAAGGDHDFPWLSKADAKNLSIFLKNPAGTVLPPPLPPTPPGGWPGFAAKVLPIYQDRCTNCHGGGRAEAGIRLHTYAGASKTARRSLFAVKAGTMPQGGKKLDPPEIQTIQDWITGGLRE
jgi:mono/diheme cytochrome c family protein